jgi:hypothetical protein
MGHVVTAPFASYSVRKNRLSFNISVVYFERKTARGAASSLAYDENNIFFVLNILNIIIVAINSTVAQRIAHDILSMNQEILSISIMDTKGNILAATSKDSFKEAFGVTRDGDKYGGTLAVAALAVANEVKDTFKEAQAIISIHENCKLMLLPIPSYEILVGFVLQRSVNAEGYDFANKIERLLVDAIDSSR